MPAALRDPGPIRFRAILQRSDASGAACWVDFPHDLKATYGKGNLVPIRATWDGRVDYRGSLAMMGGERAMLLCRKDVLARLGKGAGEEVDVLVELDLAPREVEVPADLVAAIAADSAARARWDALSPSRRGEFARWVAEAKKDDTRARRIAHSLELIAAGAPLR